MLSSGQRDLDHLVFLPRYTTADDAAWDWSDDEAVARFIAGLQRMYECMAAIQGLPDGDTGAAGRISAKDRSRLEGLAAQFEQAMDNDFNTAQAIGPDVRRGGVVVVVVVVVAAVGGVFSSTALDRVDVDFSGDRSVPRRQSRR